MLMENDFNSITLLSDGYTYDTTTSRFIAGFAIILIIGDMMQVNNIQSVLLQEIKENCLASESKHMVQSCLFIDVNS